MLARWRHWPTVASCGQLSCYDNSGRIDQNPALHFDPYLTGTSGEAVRFYINCYNIIIGKSPLKWCKWTKYGYPKRNNSIVLLFELCPVIVSRRGRIVSGWKLKVGEGYRIHLNTSHCLSPATYVEIPLQLAIHIGLISAQIKYSCCSCSRGPIHLTWHHSYASIIK